MGNCGGKAASTGAVASKEALAVDADRDGLVSKTELQKYINQHAELWAMLSVNCNIPEEKCRTIATDLAYQMAKVKANPRSSLSKMLQSDRDREPTVAEFQVLLDWLNTPQGNLEFFHRSIFFVFDKNGNGYLEPDELDSFLDLYYDADSIFKGDARLPEKAVVKQNMLNKFDANGDGQIDFQELQSLLKAGGQALVTTSEQAKES